MQRREMIYKDGTLNYVHSEIFLEVLLSLCSDLHDSAAIGHPVLIFSLFPCTQRFLQSLITCW